MPLAPTVAQSDVATVAQPPTMPLVFASPVTTTLGAPAPPPSVPPEDVKFSTAPTERVPKPVNVTVLVVVAAAPFVTLITPNPGNASVPTVSEYVPAVALLMKLNVPVLPFAAPRFTAAASLIRLLLTAAELSS